ncbi:PilZ domain-containing protein [Desulfovibrio inopinatus]|uniref:PilZ domain-containing protein n=1 Tax=Desulfovibrio inopinatus TaxID=102109 RepID=UPI00040C6BD7|nr:PilZ domain-containing protein [Desulfovibrio inopinatus]
MFKRVYQVVFGHGAKHEMATSHIRTTFQEALRQGVTFDVRLKSVGGDLQKMDCTLCAVENDAFVLAPQGTFSDPWHAVTPEKTLLDCYFSLGKAENRKLYGCACTALEPISADRLLLGFPDRLEQGERRINVRITPQYEHMPGVCIWGVKDIATLHGKAMERIPVLLTDPGTPESKTLLCNLSSGGVRLRLPAQLLDEQRTWLRPGQEVLIQLDFGDLAQSPFFMSARVNNEFRSSSGSCELGLQFTGYSPHHSRAQWEPVDLFGVDDLAKLIQGLLTEYSMENRIASGGDIRPVSVVL